MRRILIPLFITTAFLFQSAVFADAEAAKKRAEAKKLAEAGKREEEKPRTAEAKKIARDKRRIPDGKKAFVPAGRKRKRPEVRLPRVIWNRFPTMETDNLFQPGRFFIEISSGNPEPGPAGQFQDSFKSFSTSVAYQISPAFQQQRRELAALVAAGLLAKPRSATAESKRLGMEMAFTDYFGFGASLNYTAINIRTVPLVDTLRVEEQFILLVASFRNVSSTDPPRPSDYLHLLRTDVAINITTTDLDLAFHIDSGFMAPYLRLGVGRGSGSGLKVRKTGLIFGTRVRLATRYHVFLEIYQNNLKLQGVGNSGLPLTGTNITETGIRFGLGFHLAPP